MARKKEYVRLRKDKTDSKKCISCMKCIRVCKEYARSISSLKLRMTENKLKKVVT